MKIRTMRPSDYDGLVALWDGVGGVVLTPQDDSQENIERFIVRNPGLSHVAEEGGRIVGSALCGHDGRRGAIYHLAVASTHRRNGIGRKLVTACCHVLRDEGISKVQVVVVRGNEPGAAFWDALGFAPRDNTARAITLDVYFQREKGEEET